MIIDDWKKCAMAIPPLDTPLLLCSNSGEVLCGYLTDIGEEDYFWCIDGCELDMEFWYSDGYITHWTNKPKGPNR